MAETVTTGTQLHRDCVGLTQSKIENSSPIALA